MLNLIKRNTPEIADSFLLETIEKQDGKSCYEISERNGKVLLRGDCTISQAAAYYRYLKDFCRANLSHCGNVTLTVSSAPLPNKTVFQIIEQDKRAYMNYCTLGYSCFSWTWERWEREIDFMAMNGINMPLSIVGTEAVWFYTLKDIGYTDDGALKFLSGPAFWPWQLMTNIDSYFSLTDVKYIEARLELGKKIIRRQIELGMTPVQQGFSGHVPKNIIRLFPKARIKHVNPWCAFPYTYQVDPLDPLFKKLGLAFLEKQRQLFGSHHYYACDPFHEGEPPVKGDKYLGEVGRAISGLYEEFDKQSVWVMQSWSLREKIVKAVPKERLLIFDIDGTRYKENEGFWGYDFVCGNIHNFGDRNTLHGSIKQLADNQYMQAKNEYSNAVGAGLFPEGINQNPLYYDLAFHMLTQNEAIDLDVWLEDYALRRYGSDEQTLKEAVFALRDSCYSERCTGRETGSIICMRPATEPKHTAPNDVLELRYDQKTLLQAAEALIASKNAESDGYLFDVCDITRQVISNHASTLFHRAYDGYKRRDARVFERSSNAFLKIFDDLDRLLKTRKELTLTEHLNAARELATSDTDKQNYEINLLSLITVWGPVSNTELYDYSWKEWNGLVSTYYAPRWHKFFEMLAMNFNKRSNVRIETKKQPCDRNEYDGNGFYKNLAAFEKNWIATYKPEEASEEKTLNVAKELLEKYRGEIIGKL